MRLNLVWRRQKRQDTNIEANLRSYNRFILAVRYAQDQAKERLEEILYFGKIRILLGPNTRIGSVHPVFGRFESESNSG
jgi:hypothetical protein